MTELPEVVVKGMQPILIKYGIVDQNKQAEVIQETGKLIGAFATKINLANQKKGLKKFQNYLLYKLIELLKAHGITDPMQRQKCAQEILEFVYGLLKELKEEMGHA